MHEDDLPRDPKDDQPAAKPPAAVEWMIEKASANRPEEAPPLPDGAVQWAAPPDPAPARLAARQARVDGALRGNERLTAGLDQDAADLLLEWGLDMARHIVRDTAALDDTAAEAVLQPRVRAVRRLMMAAARATAGATDDAAAEWVEQAALALGPHFTRPDDMATAALLGGWRALDGRPVDQIAALRRFIAGRFAPPASGPS